MLLVAELSAAGHRATPFIFSTERKPATTAPPTAPQELVRDGVIERKGRGHALRGAPVDPR